MNWFEEQIETRHKLDTADLEDAYTRLAASVVSSGRAPRFTLDDATVADSAVDAVMAYYGAEPAKVPDDITDPMDRVEYAVRPSGIMRRAVRLEGTWWKNATGAYLATTTSGVPVALIPRFPSGYGYVDPVSHKKVRLNKTTAQTLQPEALCFYRPLPQHELSIRDVAKFMMRTLDLNDYGLIVISTAVATLIGMLPAIANKLLFARIIPSGMPSLILPIAALLIGTTLSQALIQVTSAVITARIETKMQVQMEAATYARVLLLPPTFFKEYAPGDLARRASSMSQMVDILSQSVIGTGLTAVFSLAYVFQLFAYAPQLVLPATAVIVAEAVASIAITIVSRRYMSVQMEANAKMSGLTPAILHGIQKIKLAGAEKRTFAHWAKTYAELSEATYRRPALLLAGPNLVPVIGLAGTCVMYYIAATTQVSTADYMAFSTAFGSVTTAIATLATVATLTSTIRPLLEMVEPIMRAVPEAVSGHRQITSVTGSIEASNLSFRYGESLPLVLDDISFRVNAGEYVAIVGRTGCGKSTLMRLLLGFETPTKGAIYYNGQDISRADIRSLRRNIGVVLQNGALFQGDILMNITVSTPAATIGDAWEAAELAGVADDIRKMPMGMQTLVSEGGGGISGGQRQRLLIARAVCGKPKILMFDEATSALDNVTQKHVSDALGGLKCTRVVIAHRLSTIRHADRIIMIEGGKIVEDGTYDELVAAHGKFADLVARQRLEGE